MGSFFATLAEIRPKPKKTRSGCELCRNLIDQLRRKPFNKKKKKISPELVSSREFSGFGSEREKKTLVSTFKMTFTQQFLLRNNDDS